MSSSQNHLNCLENQMSFYLESLDLDQLAQQTGLIQRCSNRISAMDWLRFFSIDWVHTPKASHEELCRRFLERHPDQRLSPQALNKQINRQESIDYFEAIFHHCLKIARQQVLQQFSTQCLSNFTHVWLQDSTQCRLSPALSASFQGTGGSASPASLKIDLLEDLKSQCIQSLEIAEGKRSDQSFQTRLFEQLCPKDLVLRDLGYFSSEALEEIHDHQAYFLTRLFKSLDLYLDPQCQTPPLELVTYLKDSFAHENTIELTVYLPTKKPFPLRLVAYRLPNGAVEERRRKAKRWASKQGKPLKKDYLEWLAFAFYLTNLPATLVTLEEIGTLYRLRWQIELTFKRWKSLLRIDYLKGSRPERIYCLIYGRLIAMLWLQTFYLFAAHLAWQQFKREVSPYKLFQWLIEQARFSLLIKPQGASRLGTQFARSMKSFLKQKRKRKTALQLVYEKIHFLQTFQNYSRC